MNRLATSTAILAIFGSLALLGAGCGKEAPASQDVNAASSTSTEQQAVATTTAAETATTTPEAPTNANAPATTKTKTGTTATAAKTNFYVEADDKGFYPGSGTAKKGAMVTVTFKVRTSNVVYNGLNIKSNKFDLGTIKGGTSRSISFPADANISFSSFWPTGAYRGAWTLYVK